MTPPRRSLPSSAAVIVLCGLLLLGCSSSSSSSVVVMVTGFATFPTTITTTTTTIRGQTNAAASSSGGAARRAVRLYESIGGSDGSGSGSDSGSGSAASKKKTTSPGVVTEDMASEYEYDESEFEDYSSDYSKVDDMDGNIDIDIDIDIDLDMDNLDMDVDNGSILDPYDDYAAIGGGGYDNLSPFEKHAREVFLTYADKVQSKLDYDNMDSSPQDNEECEGTRLANAAILIGDLYSMLRSLDVDATEDEAESLFRYLDEDGSGNVTLDEFLPWYAESIDAAQGVSAGFQSLVKSRRTVNKFDATEVDDGVLRRALECAIAAPNRRGTEPWRFIKLGKQTVGKIAELRAELEKSPSTSGVGGSFVSWTRVPHWIVVTYARSPPDAGPDGKMQQREDFKSTCCAIQNFLLSMWSEGIGTKWTDGPVQRTEEFAEICGIDLEREKVAGVIWYGFASGGLNRADVKFRGKGVEEVLDILP